MKHRSILTILVIAFAAANCFVPARSAESADNSTCRFERMWPMLPQPWYFNWPQGMAADSSGYMYVVDSFNNRIQKFTAGGHFVKAWGAYGTGDGEFDSPKGIAVDSSGYVYVADTWNFRIQKFTADGQFVKKWGSYGVGNNEFYSPSGIAADSSGYVYVTDTLNYRVQKFTADGQFVKKWGKYGSLHIRYGAFNNPSGIAVDSSGYVYVADTWNNRIQKFTSDGRFVKAFGNYGSENELLSLPIGIAVDSGGYVYVTNFFYSCIQKFTADGRFVKAWGGFGTADGEFHDPSGITADSSGYVYVSDVDNIKKFTGDGQFVKVWGSAADGDGQFAYPEGIAADSSGYVYVSDSPKNRIQKFTGGGQLVSAWGSEGSADGEFKKPWGMAADSSGYVYVADTGNNRIQKFTADGTFITKWGKNNGAGGNESDGSGDSEFYYPCGIAADSSGYVYVADSYNNRIQKFTAAGKFITKWGKSNSSGNDDNYGSGDGEFYSPEGIAADSSGNVYVADTGNNRIQKFTADGTFITKWGKNNGSGGDDNYGSGDGEFDSPEGIAADSSGNVYVADSNNNRIQKFTAAGKFLEKYGESGGGPSQFNYPFGIAVAADGRVYVADTEHKRIQAFIKSGSAPSDNGTGQDNGTIPNQPTTDKAIIVAGGGPYPGNSLWDATQLNASYAYRALTFQGFTGDTIYYLSPEKQLDLDSNGRLDEVDADITSANLQEAITGWAADARSVVIYITGQGGDGKFRISEDETLQAAELASWLDLLQGSISGKLTVVYDACESGSFVPMLKPPAGKERIVITSTSPEEPSFFLSQGAISFSSRLWSSVMYGTELYESFVLAKNAMGMLGFQAAMIDDNGNGKGNEKDDGNLARDYFIGNGVATATDAPKINAVMPAATLTGSTAAAAIWVEDIVSAETIEKVWAYIQAPQTGTQDTSLPATSLPQVELKDNGSGRYEGSYSGFTGTGTYTVVIFAMDTKNNMAPPVSVTVRKN